MTLSTEGGGTRHDRLAAVLFGLVLAVVASGLALTAAASRPFAGTTLMGLGFGLAAIIRFVIPQRDAGMLAVRGRIADVVVLGTLGAALVVLAASLRGTGSA